MLSVEAEPRYDYKLTAQRSAALLGLMVARLVMFGYKAVVTTVEIATSDEPLTELKSRLHGAARRAGTRLDSVRASAKGLTAGIVGAEVSRWRARPTGGMTVTDDVGVESERVPSDDDGTGPDAPSDSAGIYTALPDNVVRLDKPVWQCVNGHTGLSQRATNCRHCGAGVTREDEHG